MMIDRLAGNAALKDSVRLMLGSSRLTHSARCPAPNHAS